jgi:hypothetical protein
MHTSLIPPRQPKIRLGALLIRAARMPIAVIAVVGASSALAACASTQESSTSRRHGRTHAFTARETTLLYRAEQELVAECMHRHGFRYWVVAQMPASRQFPYVIDDMTWARRHGYGVDLERRIDALGRANPNQRYFAGLSPSRRDAALRAIDGARPEGLKATLPSGIVVQRSDRSCTSEAQRRLYWDLAGWYRVTKVTENLFGLRAGWVIEDPTFIAATKRWATCMRGRGYPYANPQAARTTVTTAGHSPMTERRTAVAEATCAHRSNLSDTARRLDRHYERLVRRRYAAQLSAMRRMQFAALPRAEIVESRACSRMEPAGPPVNRSTNDQQTGGTT